MGAVSKSKDGKANTFDLSQLFLCFRSVISDFQTSTVVEVCLNKLITINRSGTNLNLTLPSNTNRSSKISNKMNTRLADTLDRFWFFVYIWLRRGSVSELGSMPVLVLNWCQLFISLKASGQSFIEKDCN